MKSLDIVNESLDYIERTKDYDDLDLDSCLISKKELKTIKEDLEIFEMITKRIVHTRNACNSIEEILFIPFSRDYDGDDFKKIKQWLEEYYEIK